MERFSTAASVAENRSDPVIGDPVSVLLMGAAHPDRIGRSGVPFRPGASNPGILRESIGGAVLNAGIALRCFGARVSLVSARGGDGAAHSVIDELAHHRIEDNAIVWLDRATASYTAILDDNGELVAGIADMAIYDMLSVRALSRRHLRERLAAAEVLLLDANLPATTLHALCTESGALRAAIAVSPEKVTRLRTALPNLDLVFLSRAEARALTNGASGSHEIVTALRELGVRRAIVTDGPRPVLVIDAEAASLQEPPTLVSVRDVTGAGDTLAAITLLQFASGLSLPAAVRWGLAAASLRISDGLGPDTPTAAQRIAAALPSPIPLRQETVA